MNGFTIALRGGFSGVVKRQESGVPEGLWQHAMGDEMRKGGGGLGFLFQSNSQEASEGRIGRGEKGRGKGICLARN